MDQAVANDHEVVHPTVGPLYTTDEVAKLLRVSQRTVQVWIRDGTLTAVRYGRLLRIRHEDLVAFGEVVHPSPDAPPHPGVDRDRTV